jgi:hypothetical protein
MSNTETWKDVSGYEGRYQVSDQGRVRSLLTGKVLSLARPRANMRYMTISLGSRNNRKTFLVHRLVAVCFLAQPEGSTEVNHKNGNREDNRAENLEWCTRKENVKHARDVLLRKGYEGKRIRAVFASGESRTWPNQLAAEVELRGRGTGIVSWAIRLGRQALGASWSRV